MAKVSGNLILHGASGTLGDQIVIRQRGGKTFLSASPTAPKGEPSAAQLAQRQRFQQAVLYGRHLDTENKADYATKADGLHSAYNVAVADFLHAPDVDEIDVTNYAGAVGDTIRIRTTDDFKVVQVQVAIYNGDGSLVEQGDAVQANNEIDWIYTATASNVSLDGDKIVIKVSDKPGNITEAEEVL